LLIVVPSFPSGAFILAVNWNTSLRRAAFNCKINISSWQICLWRCSLDITASNFGISDRKYSANRILLPLIVNDFNISRISDLEGWSSAHRFNVVGAALSLFQANYMDGSIICRRVEVYQAVGTARTFPKRAH